jgi:rod shape determining protein RodA
MSFLKRFSLRSFDWPLFLSVLFLFGFGLAAIYSVDLSRGDNLFFFKKQLISGAVGLGLLLSASFMQISFYRSFAKVSYVFAVLILVGVLLFGDMIRGTRGWFDIFGFSFQPVEFAKLALILVLAYSISNFGRNFERPLFFFGTGVISFILVGLVLIQPDLGSATILVLIWFGLVMLSGARKLYLIIFVCAVGIVAVLSWFFAFQPYQKDRILTFLNPERDPLGAGYNTTQSIISIGAGGFWGKGLGFGSQSQLRFLPEAQTDFIFAVIGEELGFVGVFVVVATYSVIFWRLLVLSKNTDDDFSSIVLHGFLLLFFCQFFVNIGANLGLLPVTGVTLPFVSSGGSSLAMSLAGIGIAQSMVMNRY